jgi:hypothetical protein
MHKQTNIALDRSARSFDADGRLHIDKSHISKANVCPYYGREIPGGDVLGLDPDKVYQLLRDPDELAKAASTFARLPILSKHIPVSADKPRQDLIVGAIGSDVAFNSPYLDADLSFWDAKAIAGIETEKIMELSCAYRYVPIMEPGEFDGIPYDGRMTEIQGNHLALVEVGRAGSDVVVADSNPFNFKESAMKMTKLGKALFAAICAASPKLAADSAVPALLSDADRKTFDKAKVREALIALDATLNPEQLDNVIDALLDVEQNPAPTVNDESPADKVRSMLAGKVDDETINSILALMTAPEQAADASEDKDEDDDKMSKEEVTKAMDGLRAELLEAEQARREVRPVVGDVLGMDKAGDIYKFALDHLKVEHKDVTDAKALRALFKVASTTKPAEPKFAHDGATSVVSRFPGLKRIGGA